MGGIITAITDTTVTIADTDITIGIGIKVIGEQAFGIQDSGTTTQSALSSTNKSADPFAGFATAPKG